MIRCVAFDFDGTLMDSLLMCMQAFELGVNPYLKTPVTESAIRATFGLNEAGMVKAVVPTNWQNALHDFYQHYEKLHNHCTETFPGIRELIQFLKSQNIIVALITGKGDESCAISLKKTHLEGVFEDVLTGSDTHHNKDENLTYLMQKYHLKSDEIIYVGDTVSDVDGCANVDVCCFSAAWSSTADIAGLKARNPDFVFESIEPMAQHLKKLIVG